MGDFLVQKKVLPLLELRRSHVGKPFEVFGEEGGIGEVHLLGYMDN